MHACRVTRGGLSCGRDNARVAALLARHDAVALRLDLRELLWRLPVRGSRAPCDQLGVATCFDWAMSSGRSAADPPELPFQISVLNRGDGVTRLPREAGTQPHRVLQ